MVQRSVIHIHDPSLNPSETSYAFDAWATRILKSQLWPTVAVRECNEALPNFSPKTRSSGGRQRAPVFLLTVTALSYHKRFRNWRPYHSADCPAYLCWRAGAARGITLLLLMRIFRLASTPSTKPTFKLPAANSAAFDRSFLYVP